MVFVEEVLSTSIDEGAANDERIKILLDTGTYISSISESFAKKVRLLGLTINDKQIDLQDIGKSKVVNTSRTTVKITLGWEADMNLKCGYAPSCRGGPHPRDGFHDTSQYPTRLV